MADFAPASDGQASARASQLRYTTWGVPLDALTEEPFDFLSPALLKIDVEGLEDIVLMGAHKVLRSPALKSVLIEVDETEAQLDDRIAKILTGAGLSFVDKKRSTMFEGGPFDRTYNQIWERKTSIN